VTFTVNDGADSLAVSMPAAEPAEARALRLVCHRRALNRAGLGGCGLPFARVVRLLDQFGARAFVEHPHAPPGFRPRNAHKVEAPGDPSEGRLVWLCLPADVVPAFLAAVRLELETENGG
jgi:hypothetical protein